MGSNMIRYLLETYQEDHVLNFDKLTYAGNLENLSDVAKNSRYQFMRGDIADAVAVRKAIEEFQPDIILNYAAETHVDRSIMEPKAFLETEIIGTFTLLEAVKKYHIPRFVQISTDEVFGSIAEGQFTEEHPFAPNSPYAAAKAGADLLVRSYVNTYNIPAIVTHSCNFYGPYQFPEKMISLFITNLLEGKTVPVYGDGQNRREWIYTTDHCRAVDCIMRNGALGEVYNISAQSEISNLELTKKILAIMNLSEDRITFVKDRPGHDQRYALDSHKLETQLGWKAEKSFDDGLAETIAWYRDHTAWWKPLKSGEHAHYFHHQYGASQ